jgi:protein phosphatase
MQNPGHGIRLRSSARTNTGMVRDNNEDSIHLWTHNDHVALAIVADGMGGAVAGEEASRITVETIKKGLVEDKSVNPEGYPKIPDDELVNHLKKAITSANVNIVNQATQQPELKGMGTTVTLALIRDTNVIIGHVGDSRAYLVDGIDGHIDQITSDHSFVQALVTAGHITQEEAENHPMGNVLYRALGQASDVEVDIYYKKLHVQDRLVLCSDGLTLHVKADEIAKLALEDDPSDASQKLIDLANSRGGRDNISVIVVKVEEITPAEETVETVDVEEITSAEETVETVDVEKITPVEETVETVEVDKVTPSHKDYFDPRDTETLILEDKPGYESSETETVPHQEPQESQHHDGDAVSSDALTISTPNKEQLGEGRDGSTPKE